MSEIDESPVKKAAPEPALEPSSERRSEGENKPAERDSLRTAVDNFKPQDVREAMQAMGVKSGSDKGAIAGIPALTFKHESNDATDKPSGEGHKGSERNWMDPKKWAELPSAGNEFVPPANSMMNQARETITNTVLKLGVTDQSLILYNQKSN